MQTFHHNLLQQTNKLCAKKFMPKKIDIYLHVKTTPYFVLKSFFKNSFNPIFYLSRLTASRCLCIRRRVGYVNMCSVDLRLR